MTLNDNALTTVERLANFMGIDVPTAGSTAETKLIARINAISNFIERYTKIKFKKQEYTQEEYITERAQTINLQHYPIDMSEGVVIERRGSQLNENSWETIDGQYYVVDAKAGIVEAMSSIFFFRGQNIYRITYTAGYDFDNIATFLGDTEAGDIELAIQLIAQDMEQQTSSTGNVKAERIGDYQVTYGEIKGTAFANPDAKMILDSYAELQSGGVLTPLQTI